MERERGANVINGRKKKNNKNKKKEEKKTRWVYTGSTFTLGRILCSRRNLACVAVVASRSEFSQVDFC